MGAANPRGPALRRYTVGIRGLPRELEGLRLAHLSDTHLGLPFSARRITRAVRLALSRRPDLFVLTGDYITTGCAHIERAAELLAPLAGRESGAKGALAVLGNHDHYGDAARMRAALERVGIRVIDNGRAFMDERGGWRENPGGAALCFAGLADLEEDRPDPAAALGDVPADMPRVLLCHHPDTLELPALAAHRIDLALCGHTHGGQVSLPFLGAPIIPSRYGQKYRGGMVESPVGPAIVSRGVGMSLLPIRWNVPPEVVEVRLERRPPIPPPAGEVSRVFE